MQIPFERYFAKLSPHQAYTLSVLIVTALAGCTFFYQYGNSLMYWDENYHITSALRYIAGIAQFENHPPLGKLLIALGEYLFHPNPGANIDTLLGLKITHKVPVFYELWALRFFPALFAVIGAALFFALMMKLTRHCGLALVFSALYVFENAFIVHFRAVHLDVFQMVFLLAYLWLFLDGWQKESRLPVWHYWGMGAFLALALMVKVNVVFMGLLFPVLYLREWRQNKLVWMQRIFDILLKAGLALCMAVLVISAVFAVHLALGRHMPDPATKAGAQDIAGMSAEYKNFLINKERITPTLIYAVTTDYFRFMRAGHLSVPKRKDCNPEENGSSALHWPFMDKTITYRWFKISGVTTYVQLAGNPFSWVLGLIGVLGAFTLIVSRRVFGAQAADRKIYGLMEVFFSTYTIFMVLHVYLGTLRVMYLYHYFIGLLLSQLLFVLVFMYFFKARFRLHRWRGWAATALLAIIVASYYFVSPLTYGLAMTQGQCALRSGVFSLVKCLPDL